MSRANEGLGKAIFVRATEADVERIHALAERLGQGSQATTRAALRLGMAHLEREPGAFVSPEATGRAATTKRKVTPAARKGKP